MILQHIAYIPGYYSHKITATITNNVTPFGRMREIQLFPNNFPFLSRNKKQEKSLSGELLEANRHRFSVLTTEDISHSACMHVALLLYLSDVIFVGLYECSDCNRLTSYANNSTPTF